LANCSHTIIFTPAILHTQVAFMGGEGDDRQLYTARTDHVQEVSLNWVVTVDGLFGNYVTWTEIDVIVDPPVVLPGCTVNRVVIDASNPEESDYLYTGYVIGNHAAAHSVDTSWSASGRYYCSLSELYYSTDTIQLTFTNQSVTPLSLDSIDFPVVTEYCGGDGMCRQAAACNATKLCLPNTDLCHSNICDPYLLICVPTLLPDGIECGDGLICAEGVCGNPPVNKKVK
jgi:hypothetical protein